MESIIVSANNQRQFSLIKSLLKEMKIGFKVVETPPLRKIEYTKEEFGEKLERARKGKKTLVTDDYIKSLLA
ncbi:MAG: hypothetical protein LBE36_08020 [Flavobacteriaceae bacterium]|jgi:hypothetical protein|nr:hypothetical protein [Flavobacteriaceae bacterium]